MSETKNRFQRHPRSHSAQAGATAVEFALVVSFFLTFVFGVIELSRAVYIINTLSEVTRRAARQAANSPFDTATKEAIQQNAIFRDTPGPLLLGDPVSDDDVHIDYMYLAVGANGALTPTPITAGNMPATPADNRLACHANPYGSNCVRLVRVRICLAADSNSCTRMPYQPLVSLIPFSFELPSATTIVMAESLGYTE